MTIIYLYIACFYGRHSFWHYEAEMNNNYLYNNYVFCYFDIDCQIGLLVATCHRVECKVTLETIY